MSTLSLLLSAQCFSQEAARCLEVKVILLDFPQVLEQVGVATNFGTTCYSCGLSWVI